MIARWRWWVGGRGRSERIRAARVNYRTQGPSTARSHTPPSTYTTKSAKEAKRDTNQNQQSNGTKQKNMPSYFPLAYINAAYFSLSLSLINPSRKTPHASLSPPPPEKRLPLLLPPPPRVRTSLHEAFSNDLARASGTHPLSGGHEAPPTQLRRGCWWAVLFALGLLLQGVSNDSIPLHHLRFHTWEIRKRGRRGGRGCVSGGGGTRLLLASSNLTIDYALLSRRSTAPIPMETPPTLGRGVCVMREKGGVSSIHP